MSQRSAAPPAPGRSRHSVPAVFVQVLPYHRLSVFCRFPVLFYRHQTFSYRHYIFSYRRYTDSSHHPVSSVLWRSEPGRRQPADVRMRSEIFRQRSSALHRPAVVCHLQVPGGHRQAVVCRLRILFLRQLIPVLHRQAFSLHQQVLHLLLFCRRQVLFRRPRSFPVLHRLPNHNVPDSVQPRCLLLYLPACRSDYHSHRYSW